MVGNHSPRENARVIKPGGRLVLVGGPSGNWLGPLLRPLQALLFSPFTDREIILLLASLDADAMEDLAGLLAAGELPEVEVVTSRTQPAIFRDDLGHANQMLVDLGRLVWLRSIYGIDLDTIPAPEGYETDLNSLAQAIADEQDPR